MKYVGFALICFLSCINGVLFDTQSNEKEQIKDWRKFKIGGNITLTVPAEDNAAIEVTRAVWSKQTNILFIIMNNTIDFLNEKYEPRVSSHNESSITIRNATSEDKGIFSAKISYRNTSTNKTFSKKKWYYVTELLENETEVVVPRSNPAHIESASGVDTGAIIGIVVSLILCILIIIFGIRVYKWKCKKKNNENGYNHETRNEFQVMIPASSFSNQQRSSGNNNEPNSVPLEEIEMEPLSNNSHQNEEEVNEEERDQ